MKRSLLLSILVTGACWFLQPAMAQAPSPQQPQAGQPGSRMPGSNPNTSAQTPGITGEPMQRTKADDQKFVRDAALGGMTEVELGKLAAENVSNHLKT